MKEIKLNDCSYLRSGIVESPRVDETTLEFRNGVAVAETIVKRGANSRCRPFYDTWNGLINENFQEVYGDTLSGSYERNLMFLPFNKEIIRFGDDDFVVKVVCCNEGSSWEEYRHIRIVNGFPTLMSQHQMPSCITKVNETLMIMGNNKKALYSIDQGKMLTPYVESISESEAYCEAFDVVASASSISSKKSSLLKDFLYFKINLGGRVISEVLSSLEDGHLLYGYDFSVEKLLDQRQTDLTFRAESFERRVESFQKKDKTLEKALYLPRK